MRSRSRYGKTIDTVFIGSPGSSTLTSICKQRRSFFRTVETESRTGSIPCRESKATRLSVIRVFETRGTVI